MLFQGNQGATGKQTSQNVPVSVGEFGDVLVTELQPRYYQNTYRGQKFSALFPSAALAVAAAASSFVIVNPAGNSKNFSFIDIYSAFTALTPVATGTDIVIGAAQAPSNPTTVGTVVVPACTLIGNGAKSSALVYTTATLGATPTAIRVVGSLYGDLAAADFPGISDEIAGRVILAPGNAIAIFGVNGTPADVSIAPCITWDEVAI